jgi:O-antigen/teichoic acid export membrane protein
MKEKSMVRSAFILTIGNIISKIIGVLYVFLFSYLVSSEALALYTYAYIPYVIFLDLATLGIPIGIMKLISFYDEDKKLAFSHFLYKKIRFLSLGLGFIMFAIMFLSSNQLAEVILAGEESIHNNIKDVSNVIKIISLALLIIPNLALLRGIFNSLKQTRETAKSQIFEQLIRVAMILSAALIVINILNYPYVYAIYLAVLAAAFSGIVAYIMLYFRYRKLIKTELTVQYEFSLDLKGLLKTLWIYSIPAVMITMIISLYGFVDTLTFNKAFLIHGIRNSEIVYATYAFEINKLIMLPTALGASFGMSLIVYAKEKGKAINYNYFNAQIIKAFQTLIFIIIPIVILFMTFNKAVYASLYSYQNEYGPQLLLSAAPLIILFSFINITNGIMQSIKLEWSLVISLIIGVCLKYLYNIAFIGYHETNGAILATFIGLITTLVINLLLIWVRTRFNYLYLVRRILSMIGIACGLGMIFYLANFVLFDFKIDYSNRLLTFLYLGINGVLYILFYLTIAYFVGLLDIIFGKNRKWKQYLRFLNFKTTIKKYSNML